MDKLRQIRLAKDAMDRDWADPELDLEPPNDRTDRTDRRAQP